MSIYLYFDSLSLSDLLDIEADHVEGTGFLDVDAIDAHECIHHALPAVGGDGVAE